MEEVDGKSKIKKERIKIEEESSIIEMEGERVVGQRGKTLDKLGGEVEREVVWRGGIQVGGWNEISHNL